MADETTNLISEHLERFQAQMTAFSEQLDAVQQDMRAIEDHMAAFMSSEASRDGGDRGAQGPVGPDRAAPEAETGLT